MTEIDISDQLQEMSPEEPILKFFVFGHLPTHLQTVSVIFGRAAYELVTRVPSRSAERTVALRKLLEGKDAAVRAAL